MMVVYLKTKGYAYAFLIKLNVNIKN